MQGAFAPVDAAISEVTTARQSLTKRKTKQVSSGDEIDGLKAVAYAWFQTHRSVVALNAPAVDLSGVDASYRKIMDATAGRASRATYANALQEAKRLLVEIRSSVATAAPISVARADSTTDAPPNFAPLATDPNMQAILARRWREVQSCITSKANLAATVMMGGLLESLLLARINASANKTAVFSCKKAPRDKAGKTEPLQRWRLVDMVEVAHELTWITKSAKDVGHVLRDFRNYIHPHKEFTDSLQILEDDVHMFWEVTKTITRHVLNSVGKSP